MAVTERGKRILEYVDQELAAPEPDRRERIRQALLRWVERQEQPEKRPRKIGTKCRTTR